MRPPLHTHALAFALVTAASATPLEGQQAATSAEFLIPVGTRVRVRSQLLGPRAQVGTVAGWRGDTLVFVREGRGPVMLPLPTLWQVDVSRGRRSAATGVAQGFGIGLLAGALGGLALAAVINAGSADDDASLAYIALPLYGAAAGGALGAGLGALGAGDRWVRVLPADAGLGSPAGRPPGVLLAVSVTF